MHSHFPRWLLLAALVGWQPWPSNLRADGGEEVIQVHPVALYPGSVQEFDTDKTIRLTKDRLDAVRKFFETRKTPGDRLEPFQEERETGINLVFHKKIGGKEQSILEVAFASRKPDAEFHPALGELQEQVALGRHSEAELKTLRQKYRNLHLAYFRQVQDDEGQLASEGEVIYRAAYKAAHPKLAQGSEGERAAGKAKGRELRKQMQALKAKGDYAGMMQLAQQGNPGPRQTPGGAAAMTAMARDTWSLWVDCLEALDKAAYWTRLNYHGNALKP